ncbi:MAG: hypothetical protein H7Z38_21640 [Rubrivivax sp.]|nr:hypothetical protein [Pyrinomonadaceae bacterium]
MRRLRTDGIYAPPGGLRPVVATPQGSGYILYDSEFGPRLPPRFVVSADGTVLDWHGEEAGWTIDDLIDTGDTLRA